MPEGRSSSTVIKSERSRVSRTPKQKEPLHCQSSADMTPSASHTGDERAQRALRSVLNPRRSMPDSTKTTAATVASYADPAHEDELDDASRSSLRETAREAREARAAWEAGRVAQSNRSPAPPPWSSGRTSTRTDHAESSESSVEE